MKVKIKWDWELFGGLIIAFLVIFLILIGGLMWLHPDTISAIAGEITDLYLRYF